MRKLVSANFMRLWKDKALWITCLICFGITLFQVLGAAKEVSAESAAANGFFAERFMMEMVPMLGLFLGAFSSLFLGTEYSDGTIRNKLSVGRTRSSVYLAGFLSCLAGSMILMLSWLVGAAAFLIFSDLPLENGCLGLVGSALLVAGTMMVFAAIYTLIGNLNSNKATTVVISFGVFMVMLLAASALYDRLCEPEMDGGYRMFVDGQIVQMESIPNPLYIAGTLRKVCQIILELLSTGQAILINNMDVIHPVRQFTFSVALTALLVGIGMIFFQKKDLK